MGTFIWYSKNSSSRLFFSCGYKKIAGYNHPELVSYRTIIPRHIYDFMAFLEGTSRLFTPSLWLWLGKDPAGNEVSQVLSCLVLFWHERCIREGRSLGFIYFGGKVRNKPTKKAPNS